MLIKLKKYSYALVGLAIVLLLIGGTILLSFIVQDAVDKESQERFEKSAQTNFDKIQENLQLEVDTVFAVKALFAASQTVDRSEFEKFSQNLDIETRLPGTQAIEFITLIPRENIEEFEAAVRIDTSIFPAGYPNFSIYPEVVSDKAYVVNFIYPFEENSYAFGFDIGTNPDRIAAMQQSLELNNFVMSAPIELVQKNKTAVLFFLPVYENDTLQSTLEQRESTLKGYALTVFKIRETISDIKSEIADGNMYLKITDYTNTDTKIVYSDSEFDSINASASHQFTNTIDFGQRKWRLEYSTDDSYIVSARERNAHMLVTVVGSVTTILVLAYILRISRTNKLATSKAFDMTAELRQSKEDLADKINKLDDANSELTKYALATDNANEGIIFTNTEGNITYVNAAWSAITGYEKSEVVGHNPNIIQSGETDEKEYQKMWQNLSNGNVYHNPNILNKRKDGQNFNTDLTIFPIKDKDSSIFVGIYRDVTDDIALDEARNDFIGVASHQLRTSLSALRWYVESLLKLPRENMDEKEVKYLNTIGRSTERMRLLVESLLNISRLDLDTFIVEPKPLKLAEVIETIHQDLKQAAEEKNISLSVELDEQIPEINFDPALIEMIIENLVSNAVKYTPNDGSVTISANTTSQDDGVSNHEVKANSVLIKVKDTGYGIPEKEQEKIFSKMFRASNIQEMAAGGTGLGLYIVQQIVMKTGGDIWFESAPEKGTTFYVAFPLTGMVKKTGKAKLA